MYFLNIKFNFAINTVPPEIDLPQNITAYENKNLTISVKVIRAHPLVLPDHTYHGHTQPVMEVQEQ